ncbi:unnamed protein product [Sphagnum troendelagicum]|uniref:Glutamyl-tRNA reductase n=1 Tax=Sphagnum troendelagicum TaxID=128251 RepID=A0ABP0V3M8_9BRYO
MNAKSSILVLGLSVHSTPVEMREKLAVPEAEWPHAIAEHRALSTCNRMEIYVVALSWNRGVQEVTVWMLKTSGIPVEDLLKNLFILRDNDAIQHLFRVSAGLDSLVLGEGLFKQAITAGKRVRNETRISAGAVSVSSTAVELAVMKLSEGGLPKVNVVIVGAGKMSKLLIKHLLSKGCTRIVIVN